MFEYVIEKLSISDNLNQIVTFYLSECSLVNDVNLDYAWKSVQNDVQVIINTCNQGRKSQQVRSFMAKKDSGK